MMRRRALFFALLAIAAGVGGCGRKGDLELPPRAERAPADEEAAR